MIKDFDFFKMNHKAPLAVISFYVVFSGMRFKHNGLHSTIQEINMELQEEVDFLTLRCSCYPQCNIELNKTCHIENKFCRMVCGHWWNHWI